MPQVFWPGSVAETVYAYKFFVVPAPITLACAVAGSGRSTPLAAAVLGKGAQPLVKIWKLRVAETVGGNGRCQSGPPAGTDAILAPHCPEGT